MKRIEYTPEPDEWARRFGGEPARLSIKPGDVLRVATEDCLTATTPRHHPGW